MTRHLLLALWALSSGAPALAAPRPPAARAPAAKAPRPSAARPATRKPVSKPAPAPAARPAERPRPAASRPVQASRPTATAARPAARPAAARPIATARPPVARPPAGAPPGSFHRPPAAAERVPHAPLASDVKDQVLPYRHPDRLQAVGSVPVARPPSGPDPRHDRPAPPHVHQAPSAPPPPAHYTYVGWYSGYWCHPWYRWQYSTSAVVWFGWGVYPWYDTWMPPVRYGWSWAPGYWSAGWWVPGYWAPMGPAPMGYVYVPGWWEDEVYVEGYYRSEDRDGWEWEEGWYTADGDYVRGHWRPTGDAPEGYTWEAGFWDGDEYHDGFWRPEYLDGYQWLSAYYDADGVYRAGYWAPLAPNPGHQWVPGWFDGAEWVAGYWITDDEAAREDVDRWAPPPVPTADEPPPPAPAVPGEPPEARLVRERTERQGDKPPAVPVVVPTEGQPKPQGR